MAEFVPLYRASFSDAQEYGALDAWRASYLENIRCRDFIAESIDRNYDGHSLGGDIAAEAIAKFGFDRVNWVLANTVQRYDHDGRISAENKAWAKGFYFSLGEGDWDYRQDFAVHDRSGLVDMVARDARQAWQQLNLFGAQQCSSVYDFDTVAGQVLVLKPEMLLDEYKTPQCQLFKAGWGNGCRPNAIGRSIFGKHLIDGAKASYYRQDFLGVLKSEHMPQWAIEKMAEPEPEQTSKAMHIKVFQINRDRDTGGRCYAPLDPAQGVDPSIYDEVFDGEVDCNDLGAVFQLLHNRRPEGYRGREMDTSDVVQVLRCDAEFYGKIRWYIAPELFEECNYYDQWTFEHALEEAGEVNACIQVDRLAGQHIAAADPGFYYLGPEDFTPIEFDAEQAQIAAEDFAVEETESGMGMKMNGM